MVGIRPTRQLSPFNAQQPLEATYPQKGLWGGRGFGLVGPGRGPKEGLRGPTGSKRAPGGCLL